MPNLFAVYRREMQSFFSTPIAYLVIVIFLIVSGVLFSLILADYSRYSFEVIRSGSSVELQGLNIGEGILRPTFRTLSFLMLLMMPLLTMKSFSDEKRSGTIELLFTYPLRDSEMVLGKFFATFTVFAVMLSFTFSYILILLYFKTVPVGDMISGYLGLLLIGSAFIALGIFISSLTENQIIAAAWSFGMIMFFWVIGWTVGDSTMPIADIARYLSLFEHFSAFANGVLDSRDIIYYLSFSAIFIFFTLRVLESKRWRS